MMYVLSLLLVSTMPAEPRRIRHRRCCTRMGLAQMQGYVSLASLRDAISGRPGRTKHASCHLDVVPGMISH